MDDYNIPNIITPQDLHPVVRIANYHTHPKISAWGPRIIPDLQFIFVVKGRIEYRPDKGATCEVRRGEVLFIEPGQRHLLVSQAGRSGGTLSTLHGELIQDASWGAGDYRLNPQPAQVTRGLNFRAWHTLFRRCAETWSAYSRYQHERVSTIAREIILILAEHWNAPATVASNARMREMIEFIRDHITEPLSRRTLAAAFHITPEHVNFLFRRELDTSPGHVIQRERCLLALRLIREEGLSVKEVAPRVGYDDPFYFSRVFKRMIGSPPSEFR